MAKLTSCSVFALFAVALVFVGTTRAAPGADVLRVSSVKFTGKKY